MYYTGDDGFEACSCSSPVQTRQFYIEDAAGVRPPLGFNGPVSKFVETRKYALWRKSGLVVLGAGWKPRRVLYGFYVSGASSR
jgi:hypothetical protein